jgi:nitroreductase
MKQGDNTVNVYEAIMKRRTIRRFEDKPVPYKVLEKCVDAGRLAPSGRNKQPWEYIIVDDKQLLPRLFDNIGGSVKLPPEEGGPRPENTPQAYIIIVIDKSLELIANQRRMVLYDIGIAAENIILTALEEGIGCCPILSFNEESIKKALGIPEGYDVGLVIAMGYPQESPVVEEVTDTTNPWVDSNLVRHVPKRKLTDMLHLNRF